MDDEDDSFLCDVDLDDSAALNISSNTSMNLSLNPTSQLIANQDDFDRNVINSWIFPTQKFEKRDYQLNISAAALFNNTLIILPTGLGKTFIASVVIYNYYRWFPKSKIIFMAPTRPLVAQQINACYSVVGIQPEETTELTGRLPQESRAELWKTKRVFFATPQVVKSDLDKNIVPIETIKLVVVDEAHKAKGKYAYCEVIKKIHKFNQNFRVTALSATPGNKSEDVIEIIQNLLISKIESRNENSFDVARYTFRKRIEKVHIPLDADMKYIKDKYIPIMDVYVRKLMSLNALKSNLSNLSKGSVFKQKQAFDIFSNNPATNRDKKNDAEIKKNFAILLSLYTAYAYLVGSGFQLFLKFFKEEKDGKFKYFVLCDQTLKNFVNELSKKYEGTSPLDVNVNALPNGQIPSINNKVLIFGHPKYEILKNKLLEFFNDGGTKTIVFCEYRETVAMIYACLLPCRPTINARKLIGQGGAVSQKDQLLAMQDFRSGKINTLITTSVCEEGIDVGEVDLVICFDISSKNATRFVQRCGRTGRKREGKVLVLIAEGEADSISDIQKTTAKMNKSISCNKDIANSLYKFNPKLIPKEAKPTCVETKFVIPEIEDNAENKKKSTRKKSPVKKPTKSTILSHFQPATAINSIEELNINEVINRCHDTDLIQIELHENQLKKELGRLKQRFKMQFDALIGTVDGFDYIKDLLKLMEKNDLQIMNSLESFYSQNETNSDDEFLHRIQVTVDEFGGNHSEVSMLFPSMSHKQDFNNSFIPTQPDPQLELESRYTNQFSISELCFTPLKEGLMSKKNRLLDSSVKSLSTPMKQLQNKKRTLTSAVKTPLSAENSPLIRAFQNQKRLSASTPIDNKHTPSTSRKSIAQLTNAHTEMQLTANPSPREFFGRTTIDDIFDGFGSDDEAPNAIEPESAKALEVQTNKIPEIDPVAKLLDEDNDILLDIPLDEQIVESSICEEFHYVRRPKRKINDLTIEPPVWNLDDVFAENDEPMAHEKNIEDLPSDSSAKTEIYDPNEAVLVIDDLKQSRTSISPSARNENDVVIISSPLYSPPVAKQMRPNFSKLLNALKSPNFMSPQQPTKVLQTHNLNTSPISSTSAIRHDLIANTTKTKFDESEDLSMLILDDDDDDDEPASQNTSSFTLPIRRKTIRKRKRAQNRFIHTQAGVEGSHSSDECDDDEMLDGFITNETHFGSQNDATHVEVDMEAKYLKSLQSPSVRQNGKFKIPQLQAANISDIYSQMPAEEDDDDDYDIGSFIVDNNLTEELDSEPDELEIAERILKEKRRKQKLMKQCGGVKRRRVVRSVDTSSDEDEQTKQLRKLM